MDKNSAIDFQTKLDEVLKDTEEFVSATKQLKSVKQALDDYILSIEGIDTELAGITRQSADCVGYASKFFNGDFTKDIEQLIENIKDIVVSCEDEAKRLKDQYDEILQSDNMADLQKDHSDILDVIGELSSKVDALSDLEKENSTKLDSILESLAK